MTRFLVRRLAQAFIVIVGVVILTFAVGRLVPGDPAVTYAGPRASRAQLIETRKALGLDKSWPVQLVDYIKGVATGDWGTALHTHRPVLDDLATAVPASLELVLAALLIAARRRAAARHRRRRATAGARSTAGSACSRC